MGHSEIKKKKEKNTNWLMNIEQCELTLLRQVLI